MCALQLDLNLMGSAAIAAGLSVAAVHSCLSRPCQHRIPHDKMDTGDISSPFAKHKSLSQPMSYVTQKKEKGLGFRKLQQAGLHLI